MSRRKGRVLAFQALYSYDVGSIPMEEMLHFSWTKGEGGAGTFSQDECDFARLIIMGAVEHIEEIDTQIKKYLSQNWDFSRINRVSVAILRISAYELLFQHDTTPSIIIDEAIDIAKEYGADDSFKFINAVLDKINKSISNEKNTTPENEVLGAE